jgi:hypothetical protein
MLLNKSSYNQNTVTGAGKALAVFQFLIMIIGTPLALYMFIVTPEFLITSIVYRIFDIRRAPIGGLLTADLVLLLVTIGLIYGVKKGKVVYAIVLLLEAVSYLVIAVVGWLFEAGAIVFSPVLDHIAIYT